ncbi:MAG: VanZ family protein [Deltaproteobacteria bacterium]
MAWAAQIYNFSTATFGGVFTTWLLSQILHLAHLTVSMRTFVVLHHIMRKCAHLTEYALFSMLLYYSLGRRREWRRVPAVCALIIAGLYSLSDEFHQLFVPGRGPSIVDSGIDTFGALVGIVIVYAVCRLDINRRAARREEIAVNASP